MTEKHVTNLQSEPEVAQTIEIRGEELSGFNERLGADLRQFVERNDRDYCVSAQEARSFVIV